MKMKLQIQPDKILKQTTQLLYKFRVIIVLVVSIGLIGYAGYLGSQMLNLQPDQAYLATQREKLTATKVGFDKQTVIIINSLKQVNPTVNLTNIGKSDPFSP